jgi:chromosome segregation ATPase
MNKFLIFILLAGGAATAYRLNVLGRQNADLTSQNQDLQGQLANLKAQLLREHMKDQTEFFAAQTAVEVLQDKVKTQKEQLATAEQRLRSQRNGGGGGKQLPALRDKIAEEKQVIADLEQRLHDLHSQQDSLRNQDKYYQQQAGLTQKQADDQLKSQIAQQEETLREMVEQAKTYRESSVVNPDYRQKYSEIRAQIDVQKAAIQQLKDQRTAVNAQWGYQKATSHTQNQQDLGSLGSSEQDLRTQLAREKAALQTMNQDMNSGVQSEKSLQVVIQNAQADFDAQKAKLADLQNQLQQAQAHLAQVTPTAAPPQPNTAEQ